MVNIRFIPAETLPFGEINTFAYDLASNRITQSHTGPGGGANDTITSTYNARDELTQQVSTLHGTTTNVYDANGSLTSGVNGGQTTTYAFDVRNRMSNYASGATSASYIYNDAGQRVKEPEKVSATNITSFFLKASYDMSKLNGDATKLASSRLHSTDRG